MKVHFYSIEKDQKVSFISEATFENNTYTFKDETAENTNISCQIVSPHQIRFNRSGDTTMAILFDLTKNTIASYDNNMGLSFKFLVKTKQIKIEEHKISIEYDYFLDGEYQTTIKLFLLIK